MKRDIVVIVVVILAGLFLVRTNHAAVPSTQPATTDTADSSKNSLLEQIRADNIRLRSELTDSENQISRQNQEINELQTKVLRLQLELRTRQTADMKKFTAPFTLTPAIPQQAPNPDWNSYTYNGRSVYMVPLGQGSFIPAGTISTITITPKQLKLEQAAPTTQKSK